MFRRCTGWTGWFLGVLALLAVWGLCRAPAVSAATLFGTIGLTGENGRFVPGPMVRIYLVTEAIPFEFTDDPKLTTHKGLIYYPAPDSPCIGAGTNLPWMGSATDLAGHRRLLGQPDMGAYEFQPPRGTFIVIR